MKLSIKMVIRFCLTITAFISLAIVLASKTSQAASTIADSPCDPQYYESLSARAWLEAEREITQNQNLILKPDSVFEYTCFDRLIYELADHADEMFSETSRYGNPLSNTSMDDALQGLVGTSLITYIDNNFGSKSGAGAYNLLYGHPAATGINHQPQPITAGPSYSCDIMARVWQAAKCINFITNASTDGFFTFEEYATSATDKRYLPNAAGTCTAITANWSDNLNVALTTGPWTQDPVQTYFTLTDPVNCTSGNCLCSGTPIPTGVRVVRTGYNLNEFDEKICLQPGCHFHPGSIGGKVDDLAAGIPGPASEGCYGR
jgi:hypothetical protein